MKSNAMILAEMVNQANYAAMSYNELVTLNIAYLLAEGDIKPLIEKKALRDKPYGPSRSQNVDEQIPTANTEEYQDNGKTVLALPALSRDVEENRQLCVFYYNTKGLTAASAN